MFRDAVMARRAATGRPTPECIAQTALGFGIRESRGKKLFYNELFTISRETWLSMKYAALRECDASVQLLQERLESRRMRQRQYELELGEGAICGSGGNTTRASAHGEHIGVLMQRTGGNSGY